MALLYTLMLLAAGWLFARVLGRLIGTSAAMVPGFVAVAFAPAVVWLAFKTMPESAGLFLLALAMISLLRFFDGRSAV